jgi:hypothetical protein
MTKPMAWISMVAALALTGLGALGLILPYDVPWNRAFLIIGPIYVLAATMHLKRAYNA